MLPRTPHATTISRTREETSSTIPIPIPQSIKFWTVIGLWVAFTLLTPPGRALYAALHWYAPECANGTCYGLFFSVLAGTSGALWIALFAVFALSKYQPATRRASKFVNRVIATRDILLNAWLADRFTAVHIIFSTVAILSVAMLLPNTLAALICAAVAAITLGTLSRVNLDRYLITARHHGEWLQTAARERLERLVKVADQADDGLTDRQRARRDSARRLRKRLLGQLRPFKPQMDALQSALDMQPRSALLEDVLTKAAVIFAAFNWSAIVTALVASALTVVGLNAVYNIALRLIIDIPEAAQGRQIRSFRFWADPPSKPTSSS